MKQGRVNTAVFNLHQIKRRAFIFGTPGAQRLLTWTTVVWGPCKSRQPEQRFDNQPEECENIDQTNFKSKKPC